MSESTGAVVPFGPYTGLTVDTVAVMDPGYLLGLVTEAVGPADLRASAAQALARRGVMSVGAGTRLEPGGGTAAADAGTRAVPGGSGAAVDAGMRAVPEGGAAIRGMGEARRRPPARAWSVVLVGGALLVGGAALAVGLGERRAPPGVAAVRDTPTAAAAIAGGDRRLAGEDGVVAPRASATSPPLGLAPNASEAAPGGAAASSLGGRPCGSRSSGAIGAADAARYVDTFQAVEFEVVQTKDTGRVTYLNSHEPYAGHFYVAVFPGDYGDFAEPPALLFRGRCIVVQGTIEDYRGTPQIVLRSPDDVRVLDD